MNWKLVWNNVPMAFFNSLSSLRLISGTPYFLSFPKKRIQLISPMSLLSYVATDLFYTSTEEDIESWEINIRSGNFSVCRSSQSSSFDPGINDILVWEYFSVSWLRFCSLFSKCRNGYFFCLRRKSLRQKKKPFKPHLFTLSLQNHTRNCDERKKGGLWIRV